MNVFESISSRAAQVNPTIGEMSSDMPTSEAFAQFTPSPKTWPLLIIEFASPTPMIEPMRVCELDAGRPKYQVPTFQMIAEINSANTMAKPALEPTCRISSTGSSETMPKATAPVESSTPNRLNMPDHTTAMLAGIERV